MSPKLRIQTLVCCLFFGISTMAVMLVYSANKMIVIADVAQDAADGKAAVGVFAGHSRQFL